MALAGPLFAAVTPFDSAGKVDEGALRDYLAFLAERGVRSIIANGTTGEFPSLTLEEKQTVLRVCREHFRGTIVGNVSSCSVGATRELVAATAELCDHFLLLPPFYYANAPDDGLLDFFIQCLRDSPKPTLLYNFPRHTQNPISAGLYARILSQVSTVVGIKETTGDLATAKEKKAIAPHSRVFLGGDGLAFSALQAGIDGSATGAGGAIPEFLVQLQDSFRHGNVAQAARIQQEGDRWVVFRKELGLNDVELTKAAIRCRLPGFPTAVRPPLVEPGESARARITAQINSLQDRSIGINWKR